MADEGSLQEINRPAWLSEVRAEGTRITDQLGYMPVDATIEFISFLRVFATFGVFRYGPISIALGPLEEVFWREYRLLAPVGLPRWDAPDRSIPASTEDHVALMARAWAEGRRRGSRSFDVLDYLVAFMTAPGGLPHRVFAELGVSPERMRSYAERDRLGLPPAEERVERLYSPEEAAQYFGVRVETVRSWVRSGRLPASRLAGLKSIRIKESDLAAVLNPIAPPSDDGPPEE
jgi:excisionase family DNA binding protein